jgi:hypothetical protein
LQARDLPVSIDMGSFNPPLTSSPQRASGIFREHDSSFAQQAQVDLLHLQRAVADGILRAPTLIRVDAEGQEEIVLHALRFLFLPTSPHHHPSPPPDVIVEAYAYSLRRILLCGTPPLLALPL